MKNMKSERELKQITKKRLMEKAGIPFYKSKEYDLHHKDMTLRYNDIERYHKWRIQDVVLLTRAEHMRIHMAIKIKKGSKKPVSQKRKIRNSVIAARKRFKGMKVRVFKQQINCQSAVFSSCAKAARWLGCSKQLVSQVLRGKNLTAKGYYVELIEG